MSEGEHNANANAMSDDYPNSETETEKQGNLSRQADYEHLDRTREIATQASDTTTRTPVAEGGTEIQNSAQWRPMSASLKSSQSSQSQSSCAAKLNTQETTRIISQTPAKKANNTFLEMPGETLNCRDSKATNNASLQTSHPSVLQSPTSTSTSHSPTKSIQGQHPLFQFELQPQSLQLPSQSQTQSQSQSLLDSPSQSPTQSHSRRHLITAQQPSGGASRGHKRPDDRDSAKQGNNGHENGNSMSSAKFHAETEEMRAQTTRPSNDNTSFNENGAKTGNQPERNDRDKQNTMAEMVSCIDVDDCGVKEQHDDNIVHSNYSYYRGTTENLLTQPQSSDDEDVVNDGKEGVDYPSECEYGFPLWKRNRPESESMISQRIGRMSTQFRQESNLQLRLESKESSKSPSNISSNGGDSVKLSAVCTKEEKNGDENRHRVAVAENEGKRIGVDRDGNTQLHHLHAYSEQTEPRQQNNHILQQQLERQQGPGDASPPQHRRLQQQTEKSSGMGVDRTSPWKGSDISNQIPQHSLQALNGQHEEQQSTEVHHYNEQEQQQTKESSGKNESSNAMKIDQAPQRNESDDLNKNQLHLPRPLLRKQQQEHVDTRTQHQKEHQEQRQHEAGPIDSQHGDSIAMTMDQTHLGNRSDHQMEPPPTSQKQQQEQQNSRARQPSLEHGEMKPTAIQNEGAPALDIAPSPEGKILDESNPNQTLQLPQPLSQKQLQEVPNSREQKPTPHRHRETKPTAIQNETSDAMGNDPAPVDESNPNQQQLPNPLPQKQQQDVQKSRAQEPSSQQHRETNPTAIQNETSDAMGEEQNKDHQQQKTNPNVSQYENSSPRGIGQVSPAIGLDDTNENKQRQPQPPRQKQYQDQQNKQIQNPKELHQQQKRTISNAIHNASSTETMIEQSAPGKKIVNPNRSQQQLSHPSREQRQHDQENAPSQQQRQRRAEQRKTKSNANQNRDATVMDIDQVCPRIGLDESYQIQQQLPQPPPQQKQPKETHEQQQHLNKETASHNANTGGSEIAQAPSRSELEESHQIEQQRQFPREKEQEQKFTLTLNQNEQHEKQTDAICQNTDFSAIDNAQAPSGKGFDKSNQTKQHPQQLPKKHQPEQQNMHVMPQNEHQQQTKTIAGRNENSTAINIDYTSRGNALDESHQYTQQPPQLLQKEQLKGHNMKVQNQPKKQQHQSNAFCSLDEGLNVMAEKEIDEPNQHQKFPSNPPHKQQQEQHNSHPQCWKEQHNQNQKQQQKIIDSTATDFEQASLEEISDIPKHSQKINVIQNEKCNAMEIDQFSSANGIDVISLKNIPFSETSVNPSIRRDDGIDYVTNVEGVGEVIECDEENVSVQQAVLEKDVEMKDDDGNDATGDDLNLAKIVNRQSLSHCSDKENYQPSTDLPTMNPETSTRGQNGIISGLNEKAPDESSTEAGQDRAIYGYKDETNHLTEIEKSVENKTEVTSTDPGVTKGGIKNSAELIDRSLRRSRNAVLDEQYMQVTGLPALPVQPPSKALDHQQRKQQRTATTDLYRSTDTDHPSPVEEADEPSPKDANVVDINGERSFSRVEATVTKSNAETFDQKDLADPNVIKCKIWKRSDNECTSKSNEQSLSERIQVEPSLDVNGLKKSKTMCREAESTIYFTPTLQNAPGESKESVGVNSSSKNGMLMEVDDMVQMEKQPVQNGIGNIPSDKFHSNGTMAEDTVSELKKEGISLKVNGGNESARERQLSPALSGLTEHSQPETPRESKNALETPADATHSELEHPMSYRSIVANRIWTSSSMDDAELQGLTEDVEDKKAFSAQVETVDEMKPSSERAETKDETAKIQLPSGHRSFSSQTTVLQESTNENCHVAEQVLLSGLHVNAKAEVENAEKVNNDKQSTNGTENPQVPIASESAEWSLYAGDTQPLPIPPSFGQQRLTIPSRQTSVIDAASAEVDSRISKGITRSRDLGNNEVVCTNAETNFTSFDLKNVNYQRQNDLVDSDNPNNSDESRKESQCKNENVVFDGDKPDSLLANTIPKRTDAGSSICQKSDALDLSESRGELMKHTPDHDNHPMLPYPDDHIDPKLPESKDCPPVFENASYSKDSEPGERSQESQDLLDGSRNVMPNPVENRSINIPDKNLKNGVRAVQKPASHGQSSLSKGLKSVVESKDAEWTSSNRYPNRNENRSPPRLVLPSFKTSDNSMENERSTRNASGQNSPDASDDGSWCEPVAKGYFSDFIEDTQSQEHRRNEVKRVSSLKRLSRGPSTSTKDDDESTSEEEFQSQNYQSQSPRSIGPKILSYGMEDEVSATSSSRSQQLSGSDADFHHSSEVDIEPSQTNLNIRKQLQKMKSMAMNLPDAKELKYIISREELLEKVDSLHRKESEYKAEINHYKAVMKDFETENRELKREIEKLRKRIKEKNALLCEQAKYLETYAEFQESLQRVKKDIETSPQSTRDHSPKPKRMKKRREHEIHSDDSDTIPLSKLKSPTPIIQSKRKRAEAFHDKLNRRGIASTNPTPKSNGPKSGQRPSGPKKNSTKAKEKPPLSSDVWKVLQEKGWVYRTGPEPFNKVYVPKDGATHPGTQLGIHFFHSDQVIQAAVKRGDLSPSHGFANPKASELATNETNSETEKDGSTGNGVISSVSPFDSPETRLKSQILTLETAELCINLAVSFARNNIDETVSFRGLFFDPLWQRLKTQGSDIGLSEMNWRYEKNPDTLSTRNWCFVTPCSNAGVKGKQGEDYFVSEEQLVLRVMSEVVSLQDKPVALSRLISDNEDCISTIFPILSRAVDENLEFHEARDGKSASIRSSRVRSPTQREESTPTKAPNTSRKTPKHHRGSKESTQVKRSPSTSIFKLDNSSNKKLKKSDSTAKHLSPSFHLSQSQSAVPQVPTFQHRSPTSKQGPLSGFYFLMSGVDKVKLSREVKRLGGEPIENFSFIQQEKYRTKIFFLSDYGNWRNPKYIIAASMGVPMLHHNWVADISKEHKDHGMAKVFSSDLYSRHRLPTGLDISTGVFALQRASHARRFLKPGVDKDGGNSVFDGMRIALGLENGAERSWKLILETCGAKVETASSIARGKGTLSVDCCLFDSATLPPQETSVPVAVSRLMKFVDEQVPRLDLSWAHQCIIQRRRLPLRGEPRYSVSLEGSFHDSCQISSFKSKAGNRYGVGDLVQISRGQKSSSKGRILGITWKRNEKECQFEVQLLENSGDYELVDCPLSAKVSVNEKCLQGNIVMLDTRDFHRLGYIPTNPKQSNIFLQTRPSNESQR